ncbi:13185_t:CDS:2 [Funneliformis caledonium]|uniref:13185_t:CDS:1 n=1 Tax=Funneliformis caledonium TaxID=1117310 RepID=A0A9N8VXU5_9GLOM|nr:13185_t:CDS:2 [Funneliformis caledonium]
MIWEDPFSVRFKSWGEPYGFMDLFSYFLGDDDKGKFRDFGIITKSNELTPLFKYPTFIKILVLSHLELHLNNWIRHRTQPQSDATLSRVSMKRSVSYDKFLPELFEIIFHSTKFISNIKRLNITLSSNIQEFVLTLSTLAPCIKQAEFSDFNWNLPAVITSQNQLSSLTLKEIQMNDQILDAIKQCFRTSIKFMNCEFKQFQPLIDNPTSLKVRSLRLVGKLTEYSSLLQKIGHVENLSSNYQFPTMKEMLLIVLSSTVQRSNSFKYLVLILLISLKYFKTSGWLGPVLSKRSSSLKYLNLFLSIDPIFMRKFLDHVQNIDLKKLLIRNCHYEDIDVAFDVLKEFAEVQVIDDFVYEIVDYFCIHTKVRNYIDEVQKNKYPDLVLRIPDFE